MQKSPNLIIAIVIAVLCFIGSVYYLIPMHSHFLGSHSGTEWKHGLGLLGLGIIAIIVGLSMRGGSEQTPKAPENQTPQV